jgi:hypothetical protein
VDARPASALLGLRRHSSLTATEAFGPEIMKQMTELAIDNQLVGDNIDAMEFNIGEDGKVPSLDFWLTEERRESDHTCVVIPDEFKTDFNQLGEHFITACKMDEAYARIQPISPPDCFEPASPHFYAIVNGEGGVGLMGFRLRDDEAVTSWAKWRHEAQEVMHLTDDVTAARKAFDHLKGKFEGDGSHQE